MRSVHPPHVGLPGNRLHDHVMPGHEAVFGLLPLRPAVRAQFSSEPGSYSENSPDGHSFFKSSGRPACPKCKGPAIRSIRTQSGVSADTSTLPRTSEGQNGAVAVVGSRGNLNKLGVL